MAKLVYDETGRLLFTKEMKQEYTILMPQMLPIHFGMFRQMLELEGYHVAQLNNEGRAVVEKDDLSHGMRRTEVRSRAGDSHLGHVFTGDPESPNGVRYCINSVALRFVPYEKMEAEGYGYLLYLFEK